MDIHAKKKKNCDSLEPSAGFRFEQVSKGLAKSKRLPQALVEPNRVNVPPSVPPRQGGLAWAKAPTASRLLSYVRGGEASGPPRPLPLQGRKGEKMSAVFTNTQFWWSTSNSLLISVHHKDLKIPLQSSVWGAEGRRAVDFWGGVWVVWIRPAHRAPAPSPSYRPQGLGCMGDSGP